MKLLIYGCLFCLVFYTCSFKNSDNNAHDFSIRQIPCNECDSLPSSYDLIFAVEFQGSNLTPTMHKYIDSVVCKSTTTINNVNKPLSVYIIKDSKQVKLWNENAILHDSEHLYSNKIYLYLIYTWNDAGKFLYKGGHNHEFISDTLYCGSYD